MKNVKFPERFVTTRNMLIITVAYMLFPLYFLPKGLRALQQTSGKVDYLPLGLRPGFSPDEAWQALEILGPIGRNTYRFSEMFMDSFYAISYGIFFAFLIVFLFKQAGGRLAKMTAVAWLPLIGTLFDLLENFCIVHLIDVFPERADGWARLASVAGQAKWFFSGIALLYIMAGLAVWGWGLLKSRP